MNFYNTKILLLPLISSLFISSCVPFSYNLQSIIQGKFIYARASDNVAINDPLYQDYDFLLDNINLEIRTLDEGKINLDINRTNVLIIDDIQNFSPFGYSYSPSCYEIDCLLNINGVNDFSSQVTNPHLSGQQEFIEITIMCIGENLNLTIDASFTNRHDEMTFCLNKITGTFLDKSIDFESKRDDYYPEYKMMEEL